MLRHEQRNEGGKKGSNEFSRIGGKLAMLAIAGALACGCRGPNDTGQSPQAGAPSTAPAPASAAPSATGTSPMPQASSHSSSAPSAGFPSRSASGAAASAPATSFSALPAASASISSPGTASGTDECRAFPSIERWASKRSLEPAVVRAFALGQSGFDQCAASRPCGQGHDDGACFSPGSSKDEGYESAYDEMYDPAGNCAFTNAPPSAAPQWRFLALGLMQTVEPPYTFWPSTYNPEGVEGPYSEVFERSGLKMLDLSEARACNPRFNPFDAEDSLCLGTSKLERVFRAARAFVAARRQMLGLPEKEAAGAVKILVGGRQCGPAEAEKLLTIYVAGNIYSGTWNMKVGAGHARCPASQRTGECFADDFQESSLANGQYCASKDGRSDHSRCENGQPRASPPSSCYGYGDFVSFVSDCELPLMSGKMDAGKAVMDAYIRLRDKCRW